MKQILLVDDHPALMEGTKVMLEQEGDLNVITADSGLQALEYLKFQPFDVLLIDLHMPDINGIDLTKRVLNFDPNTIVLVYTGYDIEPHFNVLIDAGISGFVSKTASNKELVAAIRYAINGETVLPVSLFRKLRREHVSIKQTERGSVNVSMSDRELTIIKNIALGKSNKEIAEILVTSQRTMEYALTQIFQKLKVKSRREAVIKSKELGLIMADDFI